jgi:type VI secretion system protein ImpA
MPSPAVIDLEKLLAPIPGENPAGEDVSHTGIIGDIKELRRSDEEGHYGEWQPKELKTADWTKAIKAATEALATKSKDLRIAAYLVECLSKVHGVVGLRDGLRLIESLHDQYWDTLYPAIEDGDVDFRSGAVEMIDSMVPMRIREQKVTKSIGGISYTQLEWEDSKLVDELERLNSEERLKEAMADGKITGEMFRKAASTTPKPHFEKLTADYDDCFAQLGRTNRIIEEKYGDARAETIPILSKVRATLETTGNMIRDIEKVVGPLRAVEAAAADAAPEEAPSSSPAGAAMAFSGPGVPLDPVDREDAIRRLNAVANYFRKREPHSPISYLVDRAVAWGQMPLEKWLEEVVKDSGTLGHLRELLGIKPPDGN